MKTQSGQKTSPPEIRVTAHGLLRWAERALGVDMKTIRRAVAAQRAPRKGQR